MILLLDGIDWLSMMLFDLDEIIVMVELEDEWMQLTLVIVVKRDSFCLA
jgi:hypothetical protein